MDIVEASVELRGDQYVFGVVVADAFPEPAEMAGGKRVDFRFAIDTDYDAKTGRGRMGLEYSLFIVLSEGGWRGTFIHTEEGRIRAAVQAMKVTVRRNRVAIAFPRRYLPLSQFDWTVFSSSGNSPDWEPKTTNPLTMRKTFNAAGSELASPAKWRSEEDAAIEDWCRRIRQAAAQQEFSRFADLLCTDWSIYVGQDPETGEPIVSEFREYADKLDEVFGDWERVEPSEEPPIYQIDGPIALVRWQMGRALVEGQWQDIEGLDALVRRHGQWRQVSGVGGDWQMAEQDRFDPANPDHHAIQQVVDQVNRAWEKNDVSLLEQAMRPSYRAVQPDQPYLWRATCPRMLTEVEIKLQNKLCSQS